MSVPDIKHLMPNQLQGDFDLNQPVNRDIPPPKSVVPAAPPPPPLLSNPSATSPTQKTPTSILKSKPRGGLPSLPSLPPTPTEPDTGPRSSIDTSAPSLTALGLKPVGRTFDKQKTSSRATKEYEDSQTVQDIRKKFEKFEKKIPPSTAPKPTGRPQARAASNEKEDEIYHDAISAEYENSDDIPKGMGKRSSFIRKLEEQIARPAAGPQGAPKVPEIKPMTEEEECEYHEVV
nr:WAS/WASL-interacting protein family member 3-like isoform X3 [Crassostrea gigas]